MYIPKKFSFNELFKLFFSWTHLGQILIQSEPIDADTLMKAYLETFFLIRWLFAKFYHLQEINVSDSAFKTLMTANMLSDENIRLISQTHTKEAISKAIQALHQAGLLTPSDLDEINNNPRFVFLCWALEDLAAKNCLNADSFKLVTSSKYWIDVVFALKEKELLNQDHLNLVQDKDAFAVSSILGCFETLDTALFKNVFQHSNLVHVANCLNRLKSTEFLTPENIEKVLDHPHPDALSLVISCAHARQKLNTSSLESYLNTPRVETLDRIYLELLETKPQSLFAHTVTTGHSIVSQAPRM